MSDLPKDVKPFDRKEIEPCILCGKGIGHAGGVSFYEISIGQVIVDFASIRTQVGMEMIVGDPGIASILSPTTRIGARMPPNRMIVCDSCFYDPENLLMPLLLEKAISRAAEQEEAGAEAEAEPQ